MDITETEIEAFEKENCGNCECIVEVDAETPTAPRNTETACADDVNCIRKDKYGDVYCVYMRRLENDQ